MKMVNDIEKRSKTTNEVKSVENTNKNPQNFLVQCNICPSFT